MGRFLSAFVLAWAVFSATPGHTAPVELNRAQMLQLGVQALDAGQAAQTLALAEAVLTIYPDDVQALVLKARALRDLSRYDEAQRVAQAAWALAETDQEKYAAALTMAQALSSDGSRTMAQVWLRRAYERAGTDNERALAERGYAHVKAQNPWSYTLSLGVSPNSNLNNGSSADVVWIGNLPFIPVVYSGYTAQATAGISYRFRGENGATTTLGAQVFARINWFDAASLAVLNGNADPNDSQHDFDYVQAMGTFRHVRPVGANGAAIEVSASAGRTWYGWSHFADFINLGTELRLPMPTKGGSLALFATGRGQFFADPADEPVYSFETGVRYRQTVGDGDVATLTLAGIGALSADAPREYLGAKGRIDYDLGQPVLGADLSFGLGAAYRNYPVSTFDPSGRRDWMLSASVEVGLPNAAYMGFMPLLSAEIEKNLSNIAAFQSQSMRFGVGVKSQF